MKIIELKAGFALDGALLVSATARFEMREKMEGTDLATLSDLLREFQERLVSRDTGEVLADVPVEGLKTSVPDPLPSTGRRRGSQASASQSSDAPAETAPSEKPAAATPASSGGRRRGGSAAPAPDPTPAEASPAASAANRGRRGAQNAPPAETKSPSEPSDRDMLKAASGAAAKIGTEAVTLLIEGYGATSIKEIPGDQRAAFLKDLKEIGG